MTGAPDTPGKPVFDTDFIGALAEFLDGARKQKAMYDGYVEAGFTPAQAMQLMCALVSGHGSN